MNEGTASLSTIYAAIVLSCMFVPTWMIKTIKCKWTLFSCQLCYCAYIAAQFYPSFETLIPGAIILGFGAAPMWSAKCTYLTQVCLFVCLFIKIAGVLRTECCPDSNGGYKQSDKTSMRIEDDT